MKKKLILIFEIIVLFLFLFKNYSMGFVKDDFYPEHHVHIINSDDYFTLSSENRVTKLQDDIGLIGTGLTKEMKFFTCIKIVKVHDFFNSYEIQFGNSGQNIKYGWAGVDGRFNIDELKKIFGLNENVKKEDLKEGYSWNTNIIGVAQKAERGYYIYLKALYAGEDLNKINDIEINSEEQNNTVADTVQKIEKSSEFFKEFLKHPVGKIIEMFMDFFTNYIGDTIQYTANFMQMVSDKTNKDKDILYSYNELKKDSDSSNGNEGAGNRDKYTKVGEYGEGEGIVARVKVERDKNSNGEDDFSKETKIPVMIGDLYNIAVGHIDFLDANLLTGNMSKKLGSDELRHEGNSIWRNFRDFAAAIIRISIYIASAILIIALIWYGINIVRHTFDNPNARANSKEGIARIKNALLILIGTILFMALCIFGSQALFDIIEKEDSYELPIRVDVEGVYSFSTTPTGYVRYMSLTTDLEEGLQKLVYSLSYLVLAAINLLAIGLMSGRMFILWILSMLGPIIAVFYVFGRQGPLSLRTWGSLYLSFSMVQLVITIVYKIILTIVV